tara:strand:+ start:1431 stop:2612 length:1182 start_codon:yes stop_codon:yes gene_type:complete
MHYFEFGKRDATIYSGGTTSSINTGLDEILEINKVVADNGTVQNVSRILIDFDYTFISEQIEQGTIPSLSETSSVKFHLNLYDATSEEVEVEQSVFIYMVSGSWKQGTGKLDHDPVTEDGVSYQYRDQEAKTPWVTGSVLTDGGAWYTSSANNFEVSTSYDLTFDKKDIRADVTNLVYNHILSSSDFPNNGFILKRESILHPTASVPSFAFNSGSDTTKDEASTSRLGNLKYFSRETHTIYPPKLEVVWDDSSWNQGSLSALSATDLERLKIYFKNIRPEYKEGSKVKFRVVGRELYPTTNFGTTPAELDVKVLPSGSVFYEVRDAETEEVIIPYGSGSKVSCDSTGNFFNLFMDGLQAERNYRFCIKVVSGSGTTDEQINFYDDNYEFRVVR